MKHKEMRWETKDGLRLFAQKWEPESEVKSVICLAHGHGEHSGRYIHWAERLTQSGYAVITADLRGHGRSGGKRGHTPSFDHYNDDISLLLEDAAQSFPGKPCFLYGHSFGGMLALFYLIQRQPQLSGAVITSPNLGGAIMEQRFKVAMARILGSVIPRLAIPSGIEQEALSRDRAVVENYRQDPLVHDKGTMRMAKGIIATIEYIFEHANEINLPVLIMHGTGDRISYAAESEKLARLIPGDCTFKLWEGYYHELHNEPEKDKVFSYLAKWLNSNV